ncbi:MAG: sigma-70 family RNA polymerase sigma factor [Flavobacteriaceae bacterium]|jgi:RNA polymerase sigma-70 factor (ECF subfamily)|nr:MAG: RNA polymerase subunit sigma-24 [Polaribacter sp. BACL8 MAG-120531-bin13]KRP03760.1 MAG: RNA polymerase subunit sigma-24 [Polaribacter sp. BACL8 MAG-120619-bin41]KRP13192.1 MAG: RNA polymerase subunit sigma-24 [Polaribacter sp. BACL8 MAG-120419-bin8]MBT5393739.1 sigma-70 family RNA polymerase sigma factor [Flavobacteriaceae bacterium]NQV62621.1 sigma-70 family RNA polymerase sigma factor [Cryomorphaceae bacterium]|tara:strand:- start:8044 stop:8667 length:624 start_codon:yes stop_codon:yes gene_type:complete
MQSVLNNSHSNNFNASVPSDSQLVLSYLNGKRQALSILVERHRPKTYRFIYAKVQDAEVASDIVQDTFLKVIKTLDKGGYRDEGKFVSWVMRIAHNLVIDHFRRLKKMPMQYEKSDYSFFSFLTDSSKTKEETMIQEHIESNLHHIINCLPADQLEVVSLRIFKELSFKEISEQTGVSINTALGRMRYALINLRKMASENHIDLLAS